MEKNNAGEHFLAAWIAGNLSDSDLKEMIGPTEFQSYLTLRDALKYMETPAPDMEASYLKIKEKIANRDVITLNKPISYRIISTVAACLFISILFISYHTGQFGQKHYTADTGTKQLSIGKNIKIALQQNATIVQDAPIYNTREIKLTKGEAYFEVVHGTKFCIETSYGSVHVLGTKFTVNLKEERLEVVCYEGKVKVEFNDSIYYVSKGMEFNSPLKKLSYRDLGGQQKPDWLLTYKKFENKELHHIIDLIEKNYDVSITCPERLLAYNFTGTIPLNNLEEALNLVCYSFNMKFEMHGKNIIFKE